MRNRLLLVVGLTAVAAAVLGLPREYFGVLILALVITVVLLAPK